MPTTSLGQHDAVALADQMRHAPGFLWLDSAAAPGTAWSYLLADPVLTVTVRQGVATVLRRDGTEETTGPVFAVLRQLLDAVPTPSESDSPVPFVGGIAGVFGYELGHALEKFPHAPTDDIQFPDAHLGVYDEVVAVASDGQTFRSRVRTPWSNERRDEQARREWIPQVHTCGSPCAPEIVPGWESVRSTHSRERYCQAVAECVQAIRRGDLFQANLTQRLCVPVRGDPFQLYQRLRDRCRAPFSAYASVPGLPVLSVSPERFFRVVRDEANALIVEAEPIKGTRPRDLLDAERDAQLAAELLASDKDRAENLMIVDLLRNDLSRVAQPFSVVVPELIALRTFPTVHHLVSTIRATLQPGKDALDLLAAAFPGGSITGAPKVRALHEIARHEPVPRGPYCGSIGWIGFDGQADLSIAIRTVVLADNHALLGVGGGIVADSDPESEYIESLVKGHAIVEALLGRELPLPS